MRTIAIGVVLFWIFAFVTSLNVALGVVHADPLGWILMEAPSASDIHVENHSYQINGAVNLDDCLEMKATYSSDAHRWCEELIKPLDLVQALEVYHAN